MLDLAAALLDFRCGVCVQAAPATKQKALNFRAFWRREKEYRGFGRYFGKRLQGPAWKPLNWKFEPDAIG